MFISLYIFLYNENVCCYYARRYIMKIFICYYTSSYIITNKYYNYTSYCIMKNTLSCITKVFVLIIYFFYRLEQILSLYIVSYNTIYTFM